MRIAKVFFKNEEAGRLIQEDNGEYVFCYHSNWLLDSSKPGISLSLPKSLVDYKGVHLFPFFFNLLPEGVTKQLICKKKKIDADDYFGLLLEVGQGDTVGAVRVVKVEIG